MWVSHNCNSQLLSPFLCVRGRYTYLEVMYIKRLHSDFPSYASTSIRLLCALFCLYRDDMADNLFTVFRYQQIASRDCKIVFNVISFRFSVLKWAVKFDILIRHGLMKLLSFRCLLLLLLGRSFLMHQSDDINKLNVSIARQKTLCWSILICFSNQWRVNQDCWGM